jgi:hypothetical protein
MPKVVITHKVADVETWLSFKSERAAAIGHLGGTKTSWTTWTWAVAAKLQLPAKWTTSMQRSSPCSHHRQSSAQPWRSTAWCHRSPSSSPGRWIRPPPCSVE